MPSFGLVREYQSQVVLEAVNRRILVDHASCNSSAMFTPFLLEGTDRRKSIVRVPIDS